MVSIQVDVDDQLAEAMHRLNQPLPVAARELMVLELYRRHAMSSGTAGPMLGMSRLEFIKYASRMGIPFFDMEADEWEAELKRIEKV